MLSCACKSYALGLSSEAFAAIEKGVHTILNSTPDKVLRIGSACSGSGIAEVALSVLFKAFSSEINISPANLKVIFACELNKAKSTFLAQNMNIPTIFGDVRTARPCVPPPWPSCPQSASAMYGSEREREHTVCDPFYCAAGVHAH